MMWKGFQRPKHLEMEKDSIAESFGRFYAQPFERGFGSTVGNALRRVLLSSIEGAAITAIRIDGVLHEFTPIPGLAEDATDVVLNLKRLPLKLHVDRPKTLYLKTSEPGEIRARHITPDADVEILDPDAYIGTLARGATLSMEMRVKRARGYVASDKNVDEDFAIGWIPMDSVHSPIRKVNYWVEPARVGQVTDYEKLVLEIWTSGAISPRDAVGLGAKLFRDHLNIFVNIETELPEEEDEATGEGGAVPLGVPSELLEKTIEDLELSVRAYNCLKNAGVETLGDLLRRSEAELLKTKNLGLKSLNEIKEVLAGMGLSLGMSVEGSAQR